ncbi:MAG: GNAT family N-acetyltransferase, partial [Pseudomonadota bacterium]
MTLFDVLDATWPAAHCRKHAGWMLRDGAGGGKRVSAATRQDRGADIETAAQAMDAAMFMVRAGEDDLDATLDTAGYAIVDPTVIYTIPVASVIQGSLPLAKVYPVWEPLQSMKDVWAAGGIGPERLAVMHRVTGPKMGIMGRDKDVVVGAGFVALHATTAMLHALEVLPNHRRNGVARTMIQQAAHWAQAQGAETLTLAVTRANVAANTL